MSEQNQEKSRRLMIFVTLITVPAMLTFDRSESPAFVFSDSGGRPYVDPYSTVSSHYNQTGHGKKDHDFLNALQVPKFGIGKIVYIWTSDTTQPEGPFKVAAVNTATSVVKYKLCLLNNQTAKNNQEFDEGDLRETNTT